MTITSIGPLLVPGATVVAAPYAPAGPIIAGTSATPNNLAAAGGVYVWAMDQTGLGFVPGVRIRAAAADDPTFTTWIEGIVTAFDDVNITVQSDLTSGVGVHSSWNINVTGQPGQKGQTGQTGAQGPVGPPFGAPLDSPFFTGNPQAPTPLVGDNDNTIATTAFVTTAVQFAKIDTVLTGNPTRTTPPAVGSNDSSLATTAFVQNAFAGAAPLASPAFTGNPTAPTPAAGDSDTSIATTAFVTASFAPIASPVFTGTPKAPTPTAGDNTTSLSTTAFVHNAIAPLAPLISPAFSGTPSAVTPAPGDNSTNLATTAYVYTATLPLAPLISPHFTGTPIAPTPPIASTDGSIATTQFVKSAIVPLATLSSPYFIGSPTAPTQPAATSDGTLATTQFVHNGFQPLSADLSALSGVTGAGVMYYRSSAGAWSPVEMGANMTFSGGTLSSAGGGGGSGTIAEAPNDGTYYARRNLTWAANAIQVDAPSDTNPYIRINGTWTIASAAGIAPVASPAFTGNPTAPTVTPNTDNSTKLATTAFVQNALGSYASIASPNFSGVPTAPTPAAVSNDTTVATTAFVKTTTAPLAPIASPTFTGDPKAPTATAGDNDTSIATTAFVTTAISGKADVSAVAATYAPIASPTFTVAAHAPTPAAASNDTSIATTAFVATSFAPLASPTFTGTPKAPAPGNSNDTSIATTAFVTSAVAGATPAPVRLGGLLSFVSATSLKFVPFNGNQIQIQGTVYAIPPTTGIVGLTNTGAFVNGVGGSTLAPSVLPPTAVGTYYVYAFNNAGTITADFSTTGHVTSTTAGNIGVEVKSADESRTLIGIIRTDTSGHFVDTPVQRFVRSWFNRGRVFFDNSFTTGRTTPSTTAVEVNSEIRCEMVVWATDVVLAGLVSDFFSGGASFLYAAIGWDGVATDTNKHWIVTYGGGDTALGFTESKTLSEGYHYVTLMGRVSGQTGSFGGGGGGLLTALNGNIG